MVHFAAGISTCIRQYDCCSYCASAFHEEIKMKKCFAFALPVLLVSGCVQLAPITEEPVGAGLTKSVKEERLAGSTTNMVVRAFTPSEQPNQPGDEIIGAKCELVSDEIRATVITPQAVVLPNFKQNAEFANRGVPGSIAVTCNTDTARGQVLVTAQPKQAGTAVGGGLAVAVITAAVTAVAAATSPWTYPPAVVVVMTE